MRKRLEFNYREIYEKFEGTKMEVKEALETIKGCDLKGT